MRNREKPPRRRTELLEVLEKLGLLDLPKNAASEAHSGKGPVRRKKPQTARWM